MHDKLFSTALSPRSTSRYLRQLILPDFTPANQHILATTIFLIVGLGGLGIPTALYLAGMGARRLTIMDGDRVETSNLHRQVVFRERDVGRGKAEVVGEFLRGMNGDAEIVMVGEYLVEGNVGVVEGCGVVVDCTDSIRTRYLLSDHTRGSINSKGSKEVSVSSGDKGVSKDSGKSGSGGKDSGKDSNAHNMHNMHNTHNTNTADDKRRVFVCGSALRWSGEVYVFVQSGPCYRCIYPQPKPAADNCSEAGIVAAVCGVVGSLMAVEVIKTLFLGLGSRMVLYDGMECEVRRVRLRARSAKCVACNAVGVKGVGVKGVGVMGVAVGVKDGHGQIGQTGQTGQIGQSGLQHKRMVRVAEEYKISWEEYFGNRENYDLIDVRRERLFELASVKGSRNVPIELFVMGVKGVGDVGVRGSGDGVKDGDGEVRNNGQSGQSGQSGQVGEAAWGMRKDKLPVILCARGVSAQSVARMLLDRNTDCRVLRGGLRSFKKDVDSEFPL